MTKERLRGRLVISQRGNSQRNFSLRDMLRRGDVTCANSSATCFATPLRCMLQKKMPHVAVPLIKEARNNSGCQATKNPEVICRKLIRWQNSNFRRGKKRGIRDAIVIFQKFSELGCVIYILYNAT